MVVWVRCVAHFVSVACTSACKERSIQTLCCCRLAGSDPLKVQTMKLLQRHHDSCAADPACVKAEPGWTAFQRLLLLAGKHTCASHDEVLALFCSIARQRGGVGQGAAIRLLKTTDLPRTQRTTPPRSSGKYAGPRPAS